MPAPRFPRPVAPRFWKYVNKTDTCWLWMGSKSHGYGNFYFKGRRLKAHRFAWFLTYGSIPDELDCCHHCDVPSCVRPDHLFLGTEKDNMRDMLLKGRINDRRGAMNGRAKIDEDTVRAIRQDCATGMYQRDVATKYNVSSGTVSQIMCGRIWKHVS